ncbi:MAG: isoprenylcysteine carboxylmethyltransferase family protein [Actinobacteria bacterium]|nr:isoprenylcysteine carboxylmethyltransferase family protein [Actinomycetota bacterium]
MTDDERDNAGVVAPPPLIYLGPLVLGLLLNRKFPVPFLPRSAARALGWPLLVGGASLMGWFFFTMRRADTPIDPREPVSNLATDGPFRYTRNPGYLSMAMIYAGISSLANALSCILLLPAALLAIQRGVIEREERYLEQKFGEEYLRYTEQVGRWV